MMNYLELMKIHKGFILNIYFRKLKAKCITYADKPKAHNYLKPQQTCQIV